MAARGFSWRVEIAPDGRLELVPASAPSRANWLPIAWTEGTKQDGRNMLEGMVADMQREVR